MVESIDPRNGLPPPAPGPLPAGWDSATPPPPENPCYVGHEHTPPATRDDLQYACIFQLPAGSDRDCSTDPPPTACDCMDPANDNPLCQNTNTAGGQTQYNAKAYPGIRELTLLKAASSQGIVGSVCPAQVTTATSSDYGYRPAIKTIVDRLKQALGGQCLPRTLTPDANGQVSCIILEASRTNGACVCDGGMGRLDVGADRQQAVEAAKQDPLFLTAGWDCFCEIQQLTGEALQVCQNDGTTDSPMVGGQIVDGWCYVDATTAPPTGNPDIVASCPETEQRIIRFVGDGKGQPGATLFITCTGE
jgi:hypothetical protein